MCLRGCTAIGTNFAELKFWRICIQNCTKKKWSEAEILPSFNYLTAVYKPPSLPPQIISCQMCYQVTSLGSNSVFKYYEPFYQKELQTLTSQNYHFGAQQWSCAERWWRQLVWWVCWNSHCFFEAVAWQCSWAAGMLQSNTNSHDNFTYS